MQRVCGINRSVSPRVRFECDETCTSAGVQPVVNSAAARAMSAASAAFAAAGASRGAAIGAACTELSIASATIGRSWVPARMVRSQLDFLPLRRHLVRWMEARSF